MINIFFKKLSDAAVLPHKGSTDAACFDLVATEIETDYNCATVKLGFATDIPRGYKAIIVPRSSFTQKGWVMQNSPGQIDADYRGEWLIKFEAIPDEARTLIKGGEVELFYKPFPYKVGDRVAQCAIQQVPTVQWQEAEKLSETTRGTGGFGSTGMESLN